MPIIGPSSYVTTINEFIPHWSDVNVILGAAGPLVLPGGRTIAVLTDYRDQLAGFAASIPDKINDVEIARGNVELQKTALIGRLNEFNRKVRGFLGHTAYVRALPDVPSLTHGSAKILEALDDAASLWAKINAATIPGFTGPLTLLDAYPIATFTTDLAALKLAYKTLQDAEQELQLERERRNDVQDLAYAVLLAYRPAVEASFPPTHALVESMPRLTPLPGSTPDAVTATVLWNVALSQAEIRFTQSTNANLAQYEVRRSLGPVYNDETATVVANILPNQPREFFTNAGLVTSGDQASFKVFVITNTGNEAGSNAVTVTRP